MAVRLCFKSSVDLLLVVFSDIINLHHVDIKRHGKVELKVGWDNRSTVIRGLQDELTEIIFFLNLCLLLGGNVLNYGHINKNHHT